MRTVILDCDGVLLHWASIFKQWLIDHGFLESADDWHPTLYDPPIENATTLVKIFNQTHFIRNLPTVPGAIEGVRRFHEAGYCLKVCTSFSSEYASMVMREENLRNHFGNVFTEIRSVPLGADKKRFLAKHVSEDTIYIEDSMSHLIDAMEIGYAPSNLILIQDQHNISDYFRYNKAEKPILGNWYSFMENIV